MNDTKPNYKVVNSPPWILRAAHFLQKKGIRGGHHLEATARSMGLLNVLVRIELSRDIRIDVPAYNDSYNLSDIRHYEYKLINLISSRISRTDEPFLLLDCGADIGLFSALLVSACDCIQEVIAFEPNARSYSRLTTNLELLPIKAEAKNMAVADFHGTGELRFPDHDSHNHAAFIIPSEQGDIQVIKIDELDLPDSHRILCKIDVEGGELAVVKGALKTLSASSEFAVIFEAHPEQVKRVGIDPLEVVSLLGSIRACKTVVAEAPEREIDFSRPFFQQFPERVHNICVFSE